MILWLYAINTLLLYGARMWMWIAFAFKCVLNWVYKWAVQCACVEMYVQYNVCVGRSFVQSYNVWWSANKGGSFFVHESVRTCEAKPIKHIWQSLTNLFHSYHFHSDMNKTSFFWRFAFFFAYPLHGVEQFEKCRTNENVIRSVYVRWKEMISMRSQFELVNAQETFFRPNDNNLEICRFFTFRDTAFINTSAKLFVIKQILLWANRMVINKWFHNVYFQLTILSLASTAILSTFHGKNRMFLVLGRFSSLSLGLCGCVLFLKLCKYSAVSQPFVIYSLSHRGCRVC